MSSGSAWIEEQKELLTRGLERVHGDVIASIERELKRSECWDNCDAVTHDG
jgi:hypothetical protein